MVVFSLLDLVWSSIHILYDYYSKERKFSFGHDSQHFRYIRRHRSLCILLHSISIHYPFSIVAFSMFLL